MPLRGSSLRSGRGHVSPAADHPCRTSRALQPQEGWLGLTLGTPWSCPARGGAGDTPKAAPCCSWDCSAWEPDSAPAVPPGGKPSPSQPGSPLQPRDPTAPPGTIQRQRGTRQPSGHSPSLLLVTGMLWTVRSLKQDPVSTCSSTELRTKAWRSGRGQESSFRGTQPLLAQGPSRLQSCGTSSWSLGGDRIPETGPQQPRITLFLQFLNGFPPLGPLVVR